MADAIALEEVSTDVTSPPRSKQLLSSISFELPCLLDGTVSYLNGKGLLTSTGVGLIVYCVASTSIFFLPLPWSL